jgi:CheY-like chemotaxis protein
MNVSQIFITVLTSALIVGFGFLLSYGPAILMERRKKKTTQRFTKYDGQFFSEETIPTDLKNEIKEMLSTKETKTNTDMTTISKKRILLVDDEPDILEFLSYNLKKKGHEVLTAEDGLKGLASALEYKPDIIIADILMPHMNGIVMCRQMKNDERLKKIPVIFLSAVQDDYRILASIEAGGNHYISKPIRFELLYDAIQDFFTKKGLQIN